MVKVNKLTLEEIKNNSKLAEEYVKKAWFNLPDLIGEELNNPLVKITKGDLDNPHKFLIKLISNIDYIYFTAKHIFGVTLSPMQVCIFKQLWKHPFPMLIGSRGMSKTFTLAFYVMVKALLHQGSKIVLTGAGFRQSKLLFEYAEAIWAKADILRDLLGQTGARGLNNGPHRNIDRCEMIIGDSIITALPIGNGEKIRGLRAGCIIADEFDAIDTEIFETVIRGFAVVTDNPIENMQRMARLRAMQELGIINKKNSGRISSLFKQKSNQIIISGTASYSFKNFAKYWKRYKAIINSRGDFNKLSELLEGDTANMESLDHRDFCIIRVPVDLLPDGYFDSKIIASAKTSMHSSAYACEYGAVFVGDSDGFYKRSLVETCVTNSPIRVAGEPIQFSATINGNSKKKYIYGIDPASESDNFAIVVLDALANHRRVVYAWTTTKKRFREKQSKGLTKEHQFYGYCARKIRDLMKNFPCERIVMDAEGGGREVAEALGDLDKLEQGEQPIWPIINKDDPQPTDDHAGLHIIHLITFADAAWVSEANHGMKKDLEDKVLLFPRIDAVEIQLAGEADNEYERRYGKAKEDTLEDCILEIESLKEELATIQHSKTPSGRERWDTPEIKTPGMTKRGRLRKDRYSALVMANMEARSIQRKPVENKFQVIGGVVKNVMNSDEDKKESCSQTYFGPNWFVNPEAAPSPVYDVLSECNVIVRNNKNG